MLAEVWPIVRCSFRICLMALPGWRESSRLLPMHSIGYGLERDVVAIGDVHVTVYKLFMDKRNMLLGQAFAKNPGAELQVKFV